MGDVLTQALAASFGLGERPRPVGAHAERARLRVTQRVKAAIQRLESDHPPLASHLRESVQTGTLCAYEPLTPLDCPSDQFRRSFR